MNPLLDMLVRITPDLQIDELSRQVRLLADAIARAGAVMTSGTGKSRLVAERLAANLRLIGHRSFCLPAADLPHGDRGAIVQGTVVIFVSSSGLDRHVLDAAREIGERRTATIVAITNGTEGPLKEACGHWLSSSCEYDLFGKHPQLLTFHRLSLICDLLVHDLMAKGAEQILNQVSANHD